MADAPDIVGMDPADAPDFASMMRDYRASRITNPTKGSRWPKWRRGADSWGFGRCDAEYGYSPGPLTDVEDTVLDDYGPKRNNGAGQPTGRTLTPDYSLDEIEPGDWLRWVRKHGDVYVEALDPCPEEA